MFIRLAILIALFAVPRLFLGQALPTASRAAAIELGGGLVSANSGIEPDRFPGFFVFTDLDLGLHFGVEVELHQLNSPYKGDSIYERTYQAGLRYHHPIRRLDPYAKVMAGRGVFNYPYNIANIAYNLYAAGVGTDVALTHHIILRGEYEYQHWINFTPGTLSPTLLSAGAAYRF